MAKEVNASDVLAEWNVDNLRARIQRLEIAIQGERETRRYTERKLQIAVNALNEIKRLADLGRIN